MFKSIPIPPATGFSVLDDRLGLLPSPRGRDQNQRIELRYVDDDFRPALVLDDVNNSEFDGMEVLTAKEMPVVGLNRSVVVLKGLRMPAGEAMGVVRSGYE